MSIFKHENYEADLSSLEEEIKALKTTVAYKKMMADKKKVSPQKTNEIEKFCRDEIIFVYCGKKKFLNKYSVDKEEEMKKRYLGASFLRWLNGGSLSQATEKMGTNNAWFYKYNKDGDENGLWDIVGKMKADYKRLKAYLSRPTNIEFTGENFKTETSNL